MRSVFLLTSLLIAAAIGAAEPYVPAELEPWRDWVLHDHEYRACPVANAAGYGDRRAHLCAWAGVMTLSTTRTGADFSQRWRMYSDGWLSLPGDEMLWPQDVRLDGRPAAVVLHEGHPAIPVPAGVHEISGRFTWPSPPPSVPLADETGLASLSVDGVEVASARIEGGRLWLGAPTGTTAAEALRVTVHRLAEDGIPMQLTTRLRLEVSGTGREQLLGRVVPEGFVPMSMASPLPARIESDGRLRIQLRPGEWELAVTARSRSLPVVLAAPPADDGWAPAEVWSWRANDRLRVTVVEGGEPVDPARAGVPAAWRDLPAYRLEPGQSITVAQRSRGRSDSLENRIALSRDMWRDFDGAGYTTVDALNGRMQTGWRLDMARPYDLGSVSTGGDNLLVTEGDAAGLTGVEIRDAGLGLTAIGRLPAGAGTMPVTGWRHEFTEVQTRLHLPPAHRLIAAIGIDQTSGDWVGQWRLLDYFLVLFVAFALGRLFGRLLGLAALVLLALAYHEPGAPVWIWLFVAATAALARYAPAGRLRTTGIWMRNAAFAALVVLALPFAAGQLRLTVFPQLEAPARPAGYAGAVTYEEYATQAPAPDVAYSKAAPRAAATEMAGDSFVVTGSRRQAADAERDAGYDRELKRYAPGALVQTGPGIPAWSHNVATLVWAGPVASTQTMRLVVLPAWALRTLRVLVVALLAGVIWIIGRRLYRPPGKPGATPGTRDNGLPAGVVASVVAMAIAWSPGDARAQSTPDPALLDALKERLLAPPECVPRCADIGFAAITVASDRLELALEVDSLDRVALPLPGSARGWRPQQVMLGGEPVRVFHRDHRDVLWLALPPGKHRLVLAGPLPPADSVQIPFPETPRLVVLAADGWEVSGVAEGRMVSGALELVRIRSAESPAAALESEGFPVFVEVTRTLVFDVDWQIETVVRRLAPAQGGFTVTIPLLAGEQPLDDSLKVTDGKVAVGLAAGARERRWVSGVAPRASLVLTAADAPDYTEIWQLAPGPVWRVDYAGVPVIDAIGPDNRFSARFHPLPGETLTVELARPAAVAGSTLTFDRVDLDHVQGRRGSETTLSLNYRSTRGGYHALRLPPLANVVEVTTDGAEQSVRPVDGELRLPVLPGQHEVRLRWTADEAMAVRSTTPAVDLGAAAGNVTQVVRVPQDRWMLLAAGPALGPAVLYWSELAAFVLLALGLGRITLTPLKTHHWLLLGLGFSTFSWAMLLLLGSWLFAMAWRRRGPMPARRALYNTVQTGLALLSVAVLLALLVAIPRALLGYPDMHVQGNGSSAHRLTWFSDRVAGELPAASGWSVPLWMYKAAILLWALWLAFALLRWLPWAWTAWTTGGLWRGRVVAPPDTAADPPG